MAATDNDALLKAMDQLMKEEDRASVIEYAKQLSTKGGDVVGTMRKMSQQGVDTKKEAAMWKKRAILTAAVAVVVCAVMFGLMVAATEVSKESRVYSKNKGNGRLLLDTTETLALQHTAEGAIVGTGPAVTKWSGSDLYERAFATERRLTVDGTGSGDDIHLSSILHVGFGRTDARRLTGDGAGTSGWYQIHGTDKVPRGSRQLNDDDATERSYLMHHVGGGRCIKNDGDKLELLMCDGSDGGDRRLSAMKFQWKGSHGLDESEYGMGCNVLAGSALVDGGKNVECV